MTKEKGQMTKMEVSAQIAETKIYLAFASGESLSILRESQNTIQ